MSQISQDTISPLPCITIAGKTIPRMIVGSNQIAGYSHNVRALSEAMVSYYTLKRTIEFLRTCSSHGLNTWLGWSDGKGGDTLRALRDEGVKIQTYGLADLSPEGTLH